MPDSPSPQVVPAAHLFRLDNFDASALAETVRDAQIEIEQLSAGAFNARFYSIPFSCSELVRGSLNQSYRLRGTYPQDVVMFSFWFEGSSPMRVRGVDISPMDTLVVGQHGVETEMLSLGDNHYGTFTMSRARFLELAQFVYDLPADVVSTDLLILPDCKQWLNPLRQTILELEDQAMASIGVNSSRYLSSFFYEQMLTHQLLEILSHQRPPTSDLLRPTAQHRQKMLSKADDYIRDHRGGAVSLIDLCLFVGASKRSLQYAFQESYQMSPMAYLKVNRLNQTRRALLSGDLKESSVTDIALRFGFCHLGRFAQDYRAHFGESPSDTLRRR